MEKYIGVGAKDDAESITKATVSEGEIEIRDKENQKQDLAGLNRDTKNSLNKLGEIFDKTKVQEKQEFAGMFQEIAHNYIGDLTGKISKEEKAFLNSFVDGLIAQWPSGDFLAGASGTALLESMQGAISEIEDPALKQIAAGALGAIAGEIVSGNAQAGASGAISTERDNHLPHEEQEKFVKDIRKAKTNAEKFDVIEKYYKISEEYRAKDPDGAEVMEQQLMDELAKLTKYDDAGKSFELTLNKDLGLHENLRLAKEFLGLSKVLSNALPNTAKDLVIMAAEESITSANILRGSKVQIIDIAGNIIKEYDSTNLPEETMKMIVQEAGKGFAIYTAGEYAKSQGVPEGLIITTQFGIIIMSNLR